MPDKLAGEHAPRRSEQQLLRDSLAYVWSDLKEQRSFGIEWLIRLLLIAVQFIYPSVLVRTLAGRFGDIARRLGIEIYVLAKLVFLVVVIASGAYRQPLLIALTIYFLSETVTYLASLIFLADIYAPPVSWRRSVLLLLINFVEISLSFAVMYLAANPLEEFLTSPFRGVFFSVITSVGISYGNLSPLTDLGQVIVLCQILVMVLFLILLAQYLTNSFEALKAPSEIATSHDDHAGPEA